MVIIMGTPPSLEQSHQQVVRLFIAWRLILSSNRGVILQPLFIILADFNIWRNHTAAITFIYLTWVIMVVPQSWVLYSRLHLVVHNNSKLNMLMVILCFTSVILTVPTVVMGILLVSPNSVDVHVSLTMELYELTSDRGASHLANVTPFTLQSLFHMESAGDDRVLHPGD